ncbi:T9SS type A sorting domain-containing protein [uncultured Polaribacter sp.]|uniref:T9SS type A sorting domain-containing protein n=1 Tax=uncultured Polaribacter sp. TaxID=174711 RepID=UPI002602BBD8|nr:T9SS type A sorting domain-containing protein [uncultured Polaribacter sp.]
MKTKLLNAVFIASCIFSYAQTTVNSNVTGRIWMDRNLGATGIPTSIDDIENAGDIYQWGRDTDGHQLRTASLTLGPVAAGTESSNTIHLNSWDWPADWLITQDATRWLDTGGTEDPCTAVSTDFRLPTATEFQAEITAHSITNAESAFASILKLPYTGYRGYYDGVIYNYNTEGWYWTSTSDAGVSSRFYFNGTDANMGTYNRAAGMAVRCIKKETTASVNDELLLGFEMYPNPAISSSKISFKVSDVVKNVEIFVYDLTGKLIHTQKDASRTIHLKEASKGMYFVKFILDNKNTVVKELIIK